MSVFHAEVGGRLFVLENEDLCVRCAVKIKSVYPDSQFKERIFQSATSMY